MSEIILLCWALALKGPLASLGHPVCPLLILSLFFALYFAFRFLLGARLADTVELQFMTVNGETMFLGHLFLQFFNFAIFELNNTVTLFTDEVVMVMHIISQFVTGLSVPEMALFRKTARAKEVQGPVDGGQADRGASVLHLPVELFGGDMPFGPHKDMEDRLALLGHLEAVRCDVGLKNLFFFCQVISLTLGSLISDQVRLIVRFKM